MRIRPYHWSAVGSIASAFIAIYCFLWIFSAASLASEFCKNEFSLFAASFRCRQVHFAVILAVMFAGLCLYLGRVTVRFAGRRPGSELKK